MTPEFQINQLRLDKIIYALEAIAVDGLCIFALFYVQSLYRLSSNVADQLQNMVITIAVGYTLYALIGNLFRLKKIKKLEKLFNSN
jgi:hypothetical protein